jgi:hypothetical protein
MDNIYINPYKTASPAPLRWAGNFISYVFHPLFIPVYVTAFLLFIHPYAFAGINHSEKVIRLLSVGFSLTILPAFSVFLMKQLGFISSIKLRTQKERIIPYSAALIFYFWIWYVFKNQTDVPPYFVKFLLGSFLAVCVAWMCNIKWMISMHGTAMGGVVMFFLLQVLYNNDDTGLYLAIAILSAGLVATARMIVSDHSKHEVYMGLIGGMLAQLIAWYV